jgi:hypothetical protein
MNMALPDLSSATAGGRGSSAQQQQAQWSSLLASGGLPAITSGPRRIGSLWAGYGEVLELQAGKHRLVAKRVAPPSGDGGDGEDVGHARKLRSYKVEAAFYRHYAPELLADAQHGGPAEGCRIARPYLIKSEGDDATEEEGGGDGNGMVLLLEDLRQQWPNQPRKYGEEEAKRVLEWLAAFHATFFESAEVASAAAEAAAATTRRQQHKPATPEPDDSDPHVPPLLWGSGCYWHLSTRLEELESARREGGEWKSLVAAARDVDDALRGFGRGRRRFGTILHGDAKAANFMFAVGAAGEKGGSAVAGYDFQYVGGGYGPRDVAYLLCSSVDERVLSAAGGEDRLLEHYRDALLAALSKRRRGGERKKDEDPYPLEALRRHFELSLVDLCRFMTGWGWWGASRWAQQRAREIVARLPEVLEAERRSALAE